MFASVDDDVVIVVFVGAIVVVIFAVAFTVGGPLYLHSLLLMLLLFLFIVVVIVLWSFLSSHPRHLMIWRVVCLIKFQALDHLIIVSVFYIGWIVCACI